MKRLVIAGAIGVVLIGLWSLPGSSQVTDVPQVRRIAAFMRPKLQHSQKVLEGIVMKDFDMISKNARKLSLLSMDSSWQVIQKQEYFDRSREFQRTAYMLSQLADKNNLDGAALAYIQLTTQCFECHKYVRDRADDDDPIPLQKPKGEPIRKPAPKGSAPRGDR